MRKIHTYVIFITDRGETKEGNIVILILESRRSLPMASDQQEPGDYHYHQKQVYIHAQLIG